jgi:hypothetical protein
MAHEAKKGLLSRFQGHGLWVIKTELNRVTRIIKAIDIYSLNRGSDSWQIFNLLERN